MNIPKFRAWHIESKVMVDVAILIFHPVLEIHCGENKHGEELLFSQDEVTLMQSTGLTDKNGIMIFDGDLIKYKPTHSNKERTEIVFWQEFRAGWAIKLSDFANSDLFRAVQYGNQCEVIGNIHANKELLNDN
jgi:uncharacterized phage protein (TIGR01671 family)